MMPFSMDEWLEKSPPPIRQQVYRVLKDEQEEKNAELKVQNLISLLDQANLNLTTARVNYNKSSRDLIDMILNFNQENKSDDIG